MPTESACPSPEALADLLANALPAAEAEQLRRHLADCPDCRNRVARDRERPPNGTTPRHTASFPFLAPAEGPGEIGRLGDYRILGLLGEGGMAYVFDAEDTVLHRRVALKVLKPVLANPAMRERFLREARVAAVLPHDHIAAVFQVGQTEVPGLGEVPYLAMERLQGESLEDRLRRDRWLPLDEALRIARETAEGLMVAHARGLVHRDIKPANLWLETRTGPRATGPRYRVKILDFGLARLVSVPSDLTSHGQVVGTPSYMAPEQARALPVDGRTDLYSLGCVLYRMLTGAAPFDNLVEDASALRDGPTRWVPRPVSEAAPQTPRPVALLVGQLLAPNPADRPPSARALVERLRAIEAGEPTLEVQARAPDTELAGGPARPRRLGWGVWAGGLTVLLAALLGVVIGYQKWFAPEEEGEKAGGNKVTTPAGKPIKVGVLHSLSGTVSFHERPVVEATQLAITDINAKGGVLGRRVVAVIRDGASDAEVFAEKARELLEKEGVVTIFGCWTSSSRKRVEAVCAEHDRLLLYPSSYEGLEESRHVFYLGGAPNQVLLPVPRWAYSELNKRRFFLVGSESVDSKAASAILSDDLKRLGAAVVGKGFVPLGETDFAAIVARIEASKADMILNTLDGQSNVAFFQALRKRGIKPPAQPTVWFNVSETELHDFSERGMIGDYSAAGYFQSVDRQPGGLLEQLRQRSPERRVNDAMQAAYHGVYLWKKAVEAAGGTETGPLRKALKVQKVQGPEGPLRIDGPTQHTWRWARIGRVAAGGQFKVVWQSPEPLQPRPFPQSRSRAQWEEFLADLYRGWGDRWEQHAHWRSMMR